ncbi:MAG: c-type cytochrome [Lutibacter sp.]|nr:c-type cytochrome [Lutibacter sp.]
MKTLKLFFVTALLAIAFTSCTHDDAIVDPAVIAYENADAVNGGKMYDKFWRTDTDFDQNNANITTLSAKADFFRCKQCHGWDGLGNAGSYINRAPRTSRPNIAAGNIYVLGQTKTPQQLYDGLTKATGRRGIATDLSTYDPTTNATEGDKMPNLTEVLTDTQIWDLVKFLKEGMLDVTQLYDATITGTYPTGTFAISNVGKDGNAATGKTLYASKCASCHGADGSKIIIESMTVGQFTRKKGNEVQHKVNYGIDGKMPEYNLTLAQMKDVYKALADVTAFPDVQ